MFDDDSSKHADVIFPAETHAEKEGTVTHPDGRLQRLRPNVPHPGEVRPGWQALVELAAALGHETGIDSAPEVFDGAGGRGPLLRRHHATTRSAARASAGRSARRGGVGAPAARRRRASRRGDRSVPATARLPTALQRQLARLGTYRDLWADEVTERNPALSFLTRPDARALARRTPSGSGVTAGRPGRRSAPTGTRSTPGRAPRADAPRRRLPDRGPPGQRTPNAARRAPRPSRSGSRSERSEDDDLPIAEVGFAEATLDPDRQVARDLRWSIFAIVPVLTVVERKVLGRFQAPLRAQPGRPVRPAAAARRRAQADRQGVLHAADAAVPLLWALGPVLVDLLRRRDARDPALRQRRGRRSASTGSTSRSASSTSSPSARSRSTACCSAAGRRARSTASSARCAPPRS